MGKVIGSVGRTKQISSGIGVKGGKARHFHFEMSDGFSELTLLCTMAREIALLVVKVADTPFDADLCVGYQLFDVFAARCICGDDFVAGRFSIDSVNAVATESAAEFVDNEFEAVFRKSETHTVPGAVLQLHVLKKDLTILDDREAEGHDMLAFILEDRKSVV